MYSRTRKYRAWRSSPGMISPFGRSGSISSSMRSRTSSTRSSAPETFEKSRVCQTISPAASGLISSTSVMNLSRTREILMIVGALVLSAARRAATGCVRLRSIARLSARAPSSG
ncbi:MAG TPA: hypothetical protein VIL74_18810 [Pyrinomonadaceae bacterium]